VSLGSELVERLKAGASGSIEVDDGTVRARVAIRGSGQYGADVEEVLVERLEPRGSADPDRGRRMEEIVEAVGRDLTYLPEALQPLEADPASGRGVLRTTRRSVRDREYYEVSVEGGDRVDIQRFRGHAEGGRARVVENYGHGILRRVVDDLEGLVRDRRERVGDEDD